MAGIIGSIIGSVFFIAAVIAFVFFVFRGKGASYTPSAPHSHLGGKEGRGSWGEDTVAHTLRLCAGPNDKICNDIILFNTETGKSSQIDHIFICKSGIYVIETKTYAGRIYGTGSQREWTEVLAYGHTKNKFYSPIKQNNSHLYIVRKIVGEHVPVTGLFVFVTGDIKNVESDKVFDLNGLKTYFSVRADDLLSPEEIEKIYDKLILNRDSYKISRSEHVDNIRKTQREIENNICPRCGKQLVLRNGPYSKFYGCSGYPACKFKKKI